MAIRIAVSGGGPAGLYFAALHRRRNPDDEVVVFERGAADRTYGFGVVFSDQALDDLLDLDPTLHDRLVAGAVRWDDISVHHRGRTVTSRGHGFAALPRRDLLALLRERCEAVGVQLRYEEHTPPLAELTDFDLVVAADGAGSPIREALAEHLAPRVEERACGYLWLGADTALKSFEFHIVETEWGPFQLHCYPHAADRSTVVVEAREEVWAAAGLADDRPPLDALERLFSDSLAGARLSMRPGTRRQRFRKVTNEHWHHGRTVLIGDAAHTTHFSIGSGTKLAFEDAAALAAELDAHQDLPTALTAYEEQRRPVVASFQRSAQASLEWFEDLAQYLHQPALLFAFNLLTRSRRVTHANLDLRDPELAAQVRSWFAANATGLPADGSYDDGRPAMFVPIRLREVELPNRVMLSPMAVYRAQDGLIDDFHLVHLGSKALGGAGLVMTEMVAVSEDGRATLGDAGLYTDDHERAFARLVEFVHRHSSAKAGVQLGHAGRKGATRVMWEGMDRPLADGGWPLIAPSALPYLSDSRLPAEMTRADMDRVVEQFVAATRRAARAGFDLLELHCAHGYLLSSFITPLSNRRTDAYGGDLDARLRFPLEVCRAVREAWPEHLPMSVRISATDWVDGGIDGEEAVRIARALVAEGADAIDVSTGQTSPLARPQYGRSFQVPFADRIRNRVGVPTIAVGAISSYDDVNSLLLAGRADIVAMGRTMLHDPAWVLHAAAAQEYPDVPWPLSYRPGRRPPVGSGPGPRRPARTSPRSTADRQTGRA